MKEQICGTCKWHRREYIQGNYDSLIEGSYGEYECNNLKSEFCTDYTEYSHTCDEWEER